MDLQNQGYAGRYLRQYETSRYTGYERLAQPSLIVPVGAVEFPDVSFWQGEVDWDYFASRSQAVILRAGQNTWIDPRFEFNYTEAGRRGLRRGVYWFHDGRAAPAMQANLLGGLLKGREPEMEVFADWETNYGGPWDGLPRVVEFMQESEIRLPALRFPIGMYTGFYWFQEHSNIDDNFDQYAYLKTRPLWLPWYAGASIVRVPPPWTDWVHWQYGTPIEDYGQQSREIDKNRFNGSQAFFSARYGSVPAPEPPPTGESPMLHTLKVNTAALNGRSSPGGAITFSAGFKFGDILLAREPVLDPNGVTQWYPVIQCIRAGSLVLLPEGSLYASDGATYKYLLPLGSVACETPASPSPQDITFTVTRPGYQPLTLKGTQTPL